MRHPTTVLAQESLDVVDGASVTVTLVEVTDTAVRIRCRTDGTLPADHAAMAPSHTVRVVGSDGYVYRWHTSHVGGTGMDDVVDWIFHRDDPARPAGISIAASSTIDVDLRTTVNPEEPHV